MEAPPSPSGETRGLPKSLIALVAIVLVLRLVVGSFTHLTEDEAYYRLWSFAPALGYYDHPPMVAWWIWLGRHVAGDTALGVRLLPALASAVLTILVYDMALLVGAERAQATRAGLLFNATTLVLAGGFLAVPDAPASLFWGITLWCALRARRRRVLAWWLGAGIAAGLACLSKYSALFIAPGMVLWLATDAEGRRSLRQAGPWAAALMAAAIFSANIAWNAEHGWLTFAKQFGRIAPHAFAPRYLAELIVGQALLINPLVAALALAAGFARARPTPFDLRPFLWVSAPFVLYLAVHSLHDRVQAHWPAPLYPAIAISAAAGAERLAARWRWVVSAAAPFGFALGAVLLAIIVSPGGVFCRYDLALPVRGWKPFAAQIEAVRTKTGAAWVGASSYGLTSELADEKGLAAPVVQLAERERWRDVSSGPRPDLAAPGLAIDLTRRLNTGDLARCFTSVTPLGTLVRGDPGEPGKAYAVFEVQGPRRDVLAEGC